MNRISHAWMLECAQCGNLFYSMRRHSIYCSNQCRQQAYRRRAYARRAMKEQPYCQLSCCRGCGRVVKASKMILCASSEQGAFLELCEDCSMKSGIRHIDDYLKEYLK